MSSDFRFIVRMFGTDVDGNKPLILGLASIRGVGLGLATSLVRVLGMDKNTKFGDLTEKQVQELTKALEDPVAAGVPSWKVNRQKDFDTGEDRHLTTAQLLMTQREDVTRLKHIRCYRGIRHERGLKVRGQRTRSTGRRGSVVGVKKKKGGGIIREGGAREAAAKE
jgi:small subunit ribosomal protein S13